MKLLIEISDKLYNFVKSKTSAGNSRNFDGYDMYDVSRCIEHGKPLDSVLDEIKTEIEKFEYLSIEDGSDGYDEYVSRYDLLDIIDKYKEK